MKNRNQYFFILVFGIVLLSACSNNTYHQPQDSPTQGTINISVDESFKPVIDEQIKVYESSYPDTKIIASYKPEAECLKDLENDSTRMIIVARGLTDAESKYYESKLSFKPQWDILAFDAVDIIVNATAKDSLFTLKKIRNLLNGTDTSIDVAVDGNKATSTVRYLLDSVSKTSSFGNNVRAAKGSKDVVDYISNNENAVGFVGSSWVGNEEDPEQIAYSKKIRMALVQCTICDSGIFAKPSQATITAMQYPLVRPLYYILKENSNGLGTGFTNYMSLERGQLVFRRSFLVPAKMYFGVRTGRISEQ